MDENANFLAGLKVRREVLGAEYVDKTLAQVDEFTEDLQQFVTEHAWGAVWTRDGLDRKTRSFLNLAMLTALNRPAELKLHVRGALNNGVTRDELKEVFLQAAVYCGAPAGIEAFKVAKQVFAEDDKAPD